MRTWLVLAAAGLLVACGGGEGGGGSDPASLAATACHDHAAKQLEGKLFELDLVALAASMKDTPNGEKLLTGPIVIEPGMTSETKQIVECTVRFADGKDAPDIINFVFNW